MRSFWPVGGRGFVVCTGGEPTLQLDDELVDALHDADLEIAIETNGTRPAPAGVDWVCLSPKAGAGVVLDRADELKLVYPQVEPEAQPERWVDFPAGRPVAAAAWTAPIGLPPPRRRWPTASPTPNGASRCRPTRTSASPDPGPTSRSPNPGQTVR